MSDEETRPEDHANPIDDLELEGKDEGLDDEDDDDDDDDEIDDDLVATARMVGISADDYDDQEELRRAIESKVSAVEQRNAAAAAAGEGPKKLELDALEVVLANKGDLDPGMVEALEKLAKASGANFERLAEQLTDRVKTDQDVSTRIDRLAKSVAALTDQNIQLRLDRWIGRQEAAQAYLGKGDTGDLDPDEKHAKRRRSLVRRADKIARRQRGNFTMEQMFTRAFKKMSPAKAGKAPAGNKDNTKPAGSSDATRVARPSGSRTGDLVPEDTQQSREATLKEAASVVGKYRRK